MSNRESCDQAAKKAYSKCGCKYGRCSTTQGKKVTWYKASILKSIISMITPVDESIDKVDMLDKHLGDDDNKEYQVCAFIHKK